MNKKKKEFTDINDNKYILTFPKNKKILLLKIYKNNDLKQYVYRKFDFWTN